MRTAKTLIRLGGCPGWSESSVGAQPFCWFCHVADQIYCNGFIVTETWPKQRKYWCIFGSCFIQKKEKHEFSSISCKSLLQCLFLLIGTQFCQLLSFYQCLCQFLSVSGKTSTGGNFPLLWPATTLERTNFKCCGFSSHFCGVSKYGIVMIYNHRFTVTLFEPRHDKTNKVACAPSEDSDQPGRGGSRNFERGGGVHKILGSRIIVFSLCIVVASLWNFILHSGVRLALEYM